MWTSGESELGFLRLNIRVLLIGIVRFLFLLKGYIEACQGVIQGQQKRALGSACDYNYIEKPVVGRPETRASENFYLYSTFNFQPNPYTLIPLPPRPNPAKQTLHPTPNPVPSRKQKQKEVTSVTKVRQRCK